ACPVAPRACPAERRVSPAGRRVFRPRAYPVCSALGPPAAQAVQAAPPRLGLPADIRSARQSPPPQSPARRPAAPAPPAAAARGFARPAAAAPAPALVPRLPWPKVLPPPAY